MCGIAAILVSNASPLPEEALPRMVRALRHRGPDGEGLLRFPGCELGHTRLSIIDRASGAQPMSCPAGRYHLVFNGEIYNYRELRRELEQRGVVFHTQSDTEVLLLAYREFGEAVVDRLNGQFAFAIWDDHERSLFAARDRLGEKPLFWAETPAGHLLLASEIRALVATDLFTPALDPEAVDAYLTLTYVPPIQTIYSNVRTLRPGHALMWKGGRRREWAYWQPRLSQTTADPMEAALHIRHLLERAVQRQMVADVPLGAFLSGGLDSSTIVALMNSQTRQPVKTFAVGFGDLINELPFARDVAKAYHTDHTEMQMDIPVAEYLEQMADIYDEPFGDSSNIPTYLIAEFARKHVTVALSGDGGDELFGGYSWYSPLLNHDDLPTNAAALWRAKWESKVTRALSRCGLPLAARARRTADIYHGIRAKRTHAELWERHLATVSCDSLTQRQQLWEGSGTKPTGALEIYRPNSDIRGIDRAVDFDLRCYLPGDIFVKVDRASMANSLETRSPFMDVELVEFVLGLPASVRFEGGQLKPLLRRACQDLWPESVRGRSKQGFGAPLKAWLQRPDVTSLAQRVFRPGSPLIELLPGAKGMLANRRRNPQSIWSLLCLGLWLEKRPACLLRQSSAA